MTGEPMPEASAGPEAEPTGEDQVPVGLRKLLRRYADLQAGNLALRTQIIQAGLDPDPLAFTVKLEMLIKAVVPVEQRILFDIAFHEQLKVELEQVAADARRQTLTAGITAPTGRGGGRRG